jgi:CheY-like chemotaxis protein
MSKILLVDDDPAGTEPVVKFIQRSGFEVSVANDGREALNTLSAGDPPDLILLDVSMPGMSGLELLRVLRSYIRWQSIPVILLTAYADQAAVIRTANRFDAEVVSKAGFELTQLMERIRGKIAPPIK